MVTDSDIILTNTMHLHHETTSLHHVTTPRHVTIPFQQCTQMAVALAMVQKMPVLVWACTGGRGTLSKRKCVCVQGITCFCFSNVSLRLRGAQTNQRAEVVVSHLLNPNFEANPSSSSRLVMLLRVPLLSISPE